MGKSLTPDEIAQKQVRRSQAAVGDYKAGVMAVTESPTAAAAKAVERWKQGIEEAYQNNTFVDGCNAVSLGDWQSATAEKGGMNYASGVAKAAQTIADFHQQNAANQQSIDAGLRNMPRGSFEENMQRMIYQATQKKQFKFKKRRRG